MKPAPGAWKRSFAVAGRAALAISLTLTCIFAWSGCAGRPKFPPASGPAVPLPVPRPRPGYDALRDSFAAVDASGLAGRRIVLDPGHGGFFRGALGVNGLSEAEVNLGVALRLRDLLAARGALVFLTRDTDRDFLTPADSSLRADLAERVRLASAFQPDLFLSIHHNADPRGAHDVNETQTYYKLGDEGPSLDVAQDVHRALVRNVGIETNKVVPGNFFVIRNSEAPALLTESSYITNPDVEERLRLPEKQDLEARSLLIGLARYFARRVPVIEEFVATGYPAGPPDSLFEDIAAPRFRSRISGTFDEATLEVDGTRIPGLRRGGEIEWAPGLMSCGRHLAILRAGLAGTGAARPRRLAFTLARGPAELGFDFPAPVTAGGGLVAVGVRVTDIVGLPVADSVDIRLASLGSRILPRDTVITARDGVAWAYLRLAPFARPRRPGRTVLRASLTRFEGESGEHVTCAPIEHDFDGLLLKDLGLRWGFALQMPEGGPLRDAWGTRGMPPAVPWMNRDGFVVLERDSTGVVRIPAFPGYRPWPSDSAFPPRFVPLLGGALHERRIVLDPEGGGADAAGQGPGGTRAANLNLECARILAGFLAAAGAGVKLTRAGDLALSDVERVQMAEAFHAERFLRIGHRAAPPRIGCYFSSAGGQRWARQTARELVSYGLPEPEVGDDAQYVIQQTSCPSLFAAPGSLGSDSSEARLLAPGTLRAEAYALFLALAREWAPEAAWAADSLEVRDAAGRPVAGAAVTLGGALVLESDALGRVRFARTEPGPIEVVVQDPRARLRGVLLDSQRGAVLTGTSGR